MAGYMPPYMQQPYSTYMQPQPMMQQPQQTGGIDWVQGENGAKSAIVGPGQTRLLMDSEARRFYIKSADQTGMPLPLRRFSYTEEVEAVPQTETGWRDELTRMQERLDKLQAVVDKMQGGADDGKSAV